MELHRPPSSRLTTLIILVLAAVVGVAFAPTLHFDFVNYDDDEVVIENTHVHGLSAENLTWMLTESRAGHYHPLTWLSLAIDYQLHGGLRPTGFHPTCSSTSPPQSECSSSAGS